MRDLDPTPQKIFKKRDENFKNEFVVFQILKSKQIEDMLICFQLQNHQFHEDMFIVLFDV
jgi:hypothetical protein